MKVYIVFKGSGYPYSSGDIAGVFLDEKDAYAMNGSLRDSESFIEEHEVIE